MWDADLIKSEGMMRHTTPSRCLFACLAILVVPCPSRAAIKPSFMLDSSSWEATDIVVTTDAGLRDGKLSVLETWKGRLAARDTLVIPEMRRFAEAQSRTVESILRRKEAGPPIVVSGKRMALFLKRGSPQAAGQEPTHIRWQFANLYNAVEVSVVWFEGGSAFSFVQLMNHGPSLLTRIDCPEAEMKKRVPEIVRIQESLAKVAAIPAGEQRAIEAAAYVRSNVYDARKEAYNILAKCGKPAIPVLWKLLSGGAGARDDNTIDALAAAGGADVAPEFVRILDRESAFWKARAPSLQPGWWNGKGLSWSEVESLWTRYGRVLHVLYGLRTMKFQESRKPVQAFRDYWRSLPQLEDSSGLNQMSRACDEILKTLD
jgi:hypothetical protein